MRHLPDDPPPPDDLVVLSRPTARDLLAPLFRHRLAVGVAFALAMAVMAAGVMLRPAAYESEMKLLVKRERLDPVVTSNSSAPSSEAVMVNEPEVYAEMELLQSRDLLAQVVVATGIGLEPGATVSSPGVPSEASVADAIGVLRDGLSVSLIRKTTMIRAAFRSPDAALSTKVLTSLSDLYLKKHLAMHRPPGARDFFDEQASRAEEQLQAAEGKLREFNGQRDAVSATAHTDNTVAQLSRFEATLEDTRASIADANRRLASIEQERGATPARQVTQVRDDSNIEILRGLKAQVLQLEIKRVEMLQKFTPQYPPVVELEREILQLNAASEAAARTPLRDETTDQNPTHQWLRNEHARVSTERAALLARAAAVQRTVADYRARARQMDADGLDQQALLRDARTAEESYLLYQRKQEESRISDALDSMRIANVAIVEPPSVPRSPSGPGAPLLLLAAAALALAFALVVGYGLHALSPHFRTPDEVARVLRVPVVATLSGHGGR